MLLVLLGVGIFVGLALGRDTERARRSYKDLATARAAVKTGRVAMFGAFRKAFVTIMFVAGVLAAVLVVALIAGFEPSL